MIKPISSESDITITEKAVVNYIKKKTDVTKRRTHEKLDSFASICNGETREKKKKNTWDHAKPHITGSSLTPFVNLRSFSTASARMHVHVRAHGLAWRPNNTLRSPAPTDGSSLHQSDSEASGWVPASSVSQVDMRAETDCSPSAETTKTPNAVNADDDGWPPSWAKTAQHRRTRTTHTAGRILAPRAKEALESAGNNTRCRTPIRRPAERHTLPT
jgi:hypothetical protein